MQGRLRQGDATHYGRRPLTTYIALFSLTEAGIKAAKDSPRRLDAAKKLLADMGGEMKQFYMVLGEFDFVGICEAPDDAVMARYVLQLGGRRLRAHEDAEGFPGDRLPRNCPLARLKPRRFQTALPGPGASDSDVILRLAEARPLKKSPAGASGRGGFERGKETRPGRSLYTSVTQITDKMGISC